MTYSIIIPHFNSLDVLSRAVYSVPEREDIEVLIIDNSKQPIDNNLFDYRKNVYICYSPFGKGAGAARNVGLDKAIGKWLLMLDADDFFAENAFEVFDKYKDSRYDIIFFNTISYDSDSLELSTRHLAYTEILKQYQTTGDKDILRYCWSSPWGKMIKADYIKEHNIRFDETHASNDIMFSLLSGYYASDITADYTTCYCSTTRKGSLTQTPSIPNLQDRVLVASRYNRFVVQHRLSKYKRSIMFYIYQVYRGYGVTAALRLILYSIRLSNNPMIGASRWLKTYKKMNR